MIKVKIAKELDKSRWDNYVYNSKGSTFFHLYDWSTLVENTYDHKPIYLYAEELGIIKGILPLIFLKNKIFGSCLMSLPFCDYGGPLSDNKEIDNILIDKGIKISTEKNVDYFQIRSMIDYEVKDMINRTNKANLILQLNSDYKEIWAALKPKVRNQVRKAERAGLTIEIPPASQQEKSILKFYDVFSENMRDLGTPVHSINFFKSMYKIFSNKINFIHVFLDDKPIASALYISFKNTIEVPFASSIKNYRPLCPNNMLYWELIKLGCIQGKEQFIFGRSTWDSGTFKFKKQWGASPISLNYQYFSSDNQNEPIQDSKKRTYDFSRKLWSKLPKKIANSIGPHIIKNIP